jgi:hypothetical protein
MCQNKIQEENVSFFSINVEKEINTAYVNMTLEGINKLINFLGAFYDKKQVVFNEDNILNMNELDGTYSIDEVVIKFYPIDSNCLIVNVAHDLKKMYIFSSNLGIDELKDSLLDLKENLEKGKTEDISYMVPEWGGEWLIDKQVIENSCVILHLRLYGII